MFRTCAKFCLSAFFSIGLLDTDIASGQTLTTVLDSGPSSNRVDMVFVGDGYQAHEIETTYASDVDSTLSFLFDSGIAPFPRYKKFFNAHRVNVISNESGADDPANNITVDTALNATYNTGGTDRCLYFSNTAANLAVAQAVFASSANIDIDMRLGAVNSSKYGGCGGQWAVWAASNSSARSIAIHEVGHSFADLADEYANNNDLYTGNEPSEVNATADQNSGKWDRWVGYDDPDTNVGEIGYYEGARYFGRGMWRPSLNSMMRNLNRPFDAISRERFIEEIYEEVDPLDAFLATGIYESGDELWVETVDPDVINVEWFVDGQSLGLLGENVDVNSFGLPAGTYTITARAYDEILDHAYTGNSLDWWRLQDTSLLEQTASWTVNIIPEPSSGFALVVATSLYGARRRQRSGKLAVHHDQSFDR